MILVVVLVAFVLSGTAAFFISKGNADPLVCGLIGGLVALVTLGIQAGLGAL